jgi:hypothetical protein
MLETRTLMRPRARCGDSPLCAGRPRSTGLTHLIDNRQAVWDYRLWHGRKTGVSGAGYVLEKVAVLSAANRALIGRVMPSDKNHKVGFMQRFMLRLCIPLASTDPLLEFFGKGRCLIIFEVIHDDLALRGKTVGPSLKVVLTTSVGLGKVTLLFCHLRYM